MKRIAVFSVPPVPDVPGPPPNVPIPGEPVAGGKEVFTCKYCGKRFKSEDELKLHVKMDHELTKP